MMAYSYSNIYQLPCTGLRFFTVYGPLGRPDMSLFKFTKAVLNNTTVSLFNSGKHIRDFTYIDDVVLGILPIIMKPPKENIPYKCLNIGSGNPTNLKYFLKLIENYLKKTAKIKNVNFQQGDVKKTHADISMIKKNYSFKPMIDITKGIKLFIDWYKKYYNVK